MSYRPSKKKRDLTKQVERNRHVKSEHSAKWQAKHAEAKAAAAASKPVPEPPKTGPATSDAKKA